MSQPEPAAPASAPAPGSPGAAGAAEAPAAAAADAPPGSPHPFVHAEGDGVDLLAQFALGKTLDEFRRRLAKNTLRSTFLHYLPDLPVELDGARPGAPLRPRCRAGSLVEIARAPANEDVRVLEEFDERVLRDALTMREGPEKIPMPAWLDVEQKLGEDDRKRRRARELERRRKKKKRRSVKRKREAGDEQGAAPPLDPDAEAKKKKKKKRKNSEGAVSAL